jgi:hypothetical protein
MLLLNFGCYYIGISMNNLVGELVEDLDEELMKS